MKLKKKVYAKNAEDGTKGDRKRASSWDHPIEFLFSCISMSVGLGNVWRFPLVAFNNGGAAFLIPYVVVLIFVGCPLYLLEMSLGQFASSGPIESWNIAPAFRGVGYTSVVGAALVLSYYVSLMSLPLYYAIASCRSVIPWTECRPEWTSDELCVDGKFQANETNSSLSEFYYNNQAFPQWASIDNGIGPPNADLALCLFVSWVLVFLSQVNGIKNSGKLAYYTSIFPYCTLVVLLVCVLTMKGGLNGVKAFIQPDWGNLLDINVWYAAVGQCFFSLSTGSGPVIMLASHNSFKHNLYRDAVIICVMDTLNSLLAGLTTFAIVGIVAERQDIDVHQVVRDGSDFAFTFYPDVISGFEMAPQFFSALYFLMLFTLGLGSSTALAGGIIRVIDDKFPRCKPWAITLAVCVVGFFSGLVYITPGGHFILTLVDSFGAGFVIYIAAILELAAVCWVYGLTNFSIDVEFMLGRTVGIYWKCCWAAVIPLGLSYILLNTIGAQSQLKHKLQDFPAPAITAGWALASFSLILIPVFAIHEIGASDGDTWREKIRNGFQPTERWGPKEKEVKKLWIAHRRERLLHGMEL